MGNQRLVSAGVCLRRQDCDGADGILSCAEPRHRRAETGPAEPKNGWIFILSPSCQSAAVWRDRTRWGERLIERLACLRMRLLIEVWEKRQLLPVYLLLPPVSHPLLVVLLFLSQNSAASQGFSSQSLLVTCNLGRRAPPFISPL